ncbi:DNA methylase, partial [Candidatus Woesearchaeota archaeon]|nr:DNA methylase [Candidatus Woesearchaeota archaeon]
MDITKSKLAIILSKLANNDKQNIGLEQYELPSERAADLLWG